MRSRCFPSPQHSQYAKGMIPPARSAPPGPSRAARPAPAPVLADDDVDIVEETPKPRFGIMAKSLVAMLVVGFLPLTLFAAVTLRQQAASSRADAQAAVRQNAERIAAQVDEWFDKNVRVLRAASSLPAVSTMQPEAQTPVLTAVQQAYPWMYLVFTIGPNGQNLARSDGKPLTDYSDRQYYKDVMSGKPLAWELVMGKTSNKAALILAMPVKSQNQTVGVFAAAMTVEDVSRIAANWRMGETGFAFVVDDKSKVVAHPREEFVATPTYLNGHPLVAAFHASGKPSLLSFTETNGNEAIGYVQGNAYGWAIATQYEEREVFAPVRRTLTVGLALLAAAIVLVAVFARLFARVLIKPIVDLTAAADRMSLGELSQPIASERADEIGLLAHALERLRRSMKAAFDRLAR
jgi:methyl-accepting chemotaxis protein